MKVRIIGVDCATNPVRVGLALGLWQGQTATLLEVRAGSDQEPLACTICGWMDDVLPTLIAMDAPLGWPIALGEKLVQHTAGEVLDIPANQLFRRETDLELRK